MRLTPNRFWKRDLSERVRILLKHLLQPWGRSQMAHQILWLISSETNGSTMQSNTTLKVSPLLTQVGSPQSSSRSSSSMLLSLKMKKTNQNFQVSKPQLKRLRFRLKIWKLHPSESEAGRRKLSLLSLKLSQSQMHRRRKLWLTLAWPDRIRLCRILYKRRGVDREKIN